MLRLSSLLFLISINILAQDATNVFDICDSLYIEGKYDEIFDLIDEKLEEDLNPTELFKCYAWKTNAAHYSLNSTQTNLYAQQALALSKTIPSIDTLELYSDVLYSTSVIFYRHGEVDSAFHYCELALKLQEKHLEPGDRKISQSLNAMGVYHKYRGHFEGAILYQTKALNLALNKEQPDYNSVVAATYSLASSYISLNDFVKAEKLCRTAIKYYDDGLANFNRFKAHIYNALGVIYGFQNDIETAIEYYREALRLFKKYMPEDSPAISASLSNIALYKMNIGEYIEANELILEAIEMLEKENLRSDLYHKYYLLGVNANERGEYEEALSHLNFALNEILHIYNGHNQLSTLTLNEIARSHTKLGHYDIAQEKLEESISVAKQLFGKKDQNLAESYLSQARVQYLLQDYEKCISYLDTFTNTIQITENDTSFLQNESISKPLLLNSNSLKNKCYWKLYQQSQDQDYLIKTYDLAIQSLDLSIEIINYYYHETSIISFFGYVDKNLKQGIRACKLLYDHTGDPKYINQAFIFFEAEKSILLKREIQDAYAKLNTNIPDTLIGKEIQLKTTISDLQKDIFNSDETNEKLINSIEQELFETNRELEKLLSTIESDHHNYYALKYKRFVPNIFEIQAKLEPNTTLIEYYQLENQVYSISVTDDQLLFNIDSISDLSSKIEQYNQAIQNSEFSTYSELAYQFYVHLIKPNIHKNTESIIFVPSKELSLLSFDSFISSKKKNATYRNLDYLINSHHILYQNSAIEKQKPSTIPNKTYLGISPNFANTDYKMLIGARREIVTISKSLNGDILVDSQATKNNLINKINDYRILHFGTHAETDTLDSNYSKLLLNSEEKANNTEALYSYEIQNTQLNTDLVILSACNTSIGDIKAGEGVASLARSFYYAGAKASLTSLWSIPDYSTSRIVNSFFENINKNSKSKALQEAKLKYLSRSDEHTANPKYWSGIVITGDNSPIDMHPKGFSWFYILCAISISLIFWMKFIK